MRKRLSWILLASIATSSAIAVAQNAGGSNAAAPPGQPQHTDGAGDKAALPIDAGFWPTEKMIQRMLDRMSEGLAEHYDFDDEQMLRAREAMDHFPKWMQENRGQIQSLMNEYFEALLDKQAPTPESVAAWSQKVLPLIKSFDSVMGDVTEEMKTFMTDDQRVILEGEMAGYKLGVGMVSNKLSVWADGNYDPENEWIGSREQRDEMRRQDIERARKMKEARDTKIDELGGSPLDKTNRRAADTGGGKRDANSNSKKPSAADEWVKYTEDFIRRYQLDDKQAEQAHTMLKFAVEERDTYKLRIATDLERADKKLAEAKTDADKKTAKTEAERVRRPLERRFAEFKSKLDKLPTAKQKQAAAMQEANRTDKEKTKTERAKSAEPAPKTASDTPAEGANGDAKGKAETPAEAEKKEGPSSP